uniref:Uncharacterized protein n=1 Tax=Vitis vinifera TaxID=29760 RepID=A5B2C9_VITVI|nr:hypothetical protein VITISV_034102 [Vitis vinifera]
MDFYQSMTTQGVQSPIAIRFSIDGCQGILEAASTNPPATPPVLPVAPPPSLDFITISGSEFRGMTDIPRPLELRAPVEEMIPAKETITTDVSPQATHETGPRAIMCLGIKFRSQKFGVKSEELVVERSLKLDALNLDWLGVIDGPPLHGHFRK